MTSLYGHRWSSSYGDNPRGAGGKQWALTLAGFTREQIDTGLDACRATGEEWPPSAPQFKTRCLGIPTFARVRADLHTRSLGFTRLVWQQLNPWAFRQANLREAERQLRVAYEVAVELRMYGEELPEEPVGEIEHVKPRVVRASPETIRALGEALGIEAPRVCSGSSRPQSREQNSEQLSVSTETDASLLFARPGEKIAT